MLIEHNFYRLHKCYITKNNGKIVELESRLPISFLLSLFGFKGRMEHYTCVLGEPSSGNYYTSTKWSCSTGKLVDLQEYNRTLEYMYIAENLKCNVEPWEDRNLTQDEKDIKDIIR